MKHELSIYLIAGNEEEYIGRCLESFKPVAKEFVVAIARGNQTPDKTEEICKSFGAKVVHYKNKRIDWPHIDDFAEARNLALDNCSCEWAAWVDADDVMAEGCEEAIDRALDEAEKQDKWLVAMRYDVANAGLKPLRETFSRKGKCRWRNRVHEMLVASEPDKLVAVDQTFRIHKPHGYKQTSADRNFRILADTLEPAPNSLYYTAQEAYLSNQVERCIDYSKRALMFPELDDTLRYDVLCNLGRCTGKDERLKWLGQAITLQPDRREAHYYTAMEYASHGIWNKAYASSRSAMTLQRPKTHYWNQVEDVYDWKALDLYQIACVCVGNTEESEKMLKMWPTPKITLVHATRGRPQLAWQRRYQWLSLAQKPLEIQWIFAVDHDEKVDYTPHQAIRCNPGGIINAWNEGAKHAKGDVIIQMSDDWSPCKHWDTLILNAIGDTKADRVLAVSDGLRQDKLLCMAILTQNRLNKQGYMFHPDYQTSDGIYSDNEFTERAYADGVVIEAKDIQFKHENPLFTKGNADEQLKNHNKPEFYDKGKTIYDRRKANNWM